MSTTETVHRRGLCDLVHGSVSTATCTVSIEGGRLLVLWRCHDRHIWEEIFLDFRRTFPRHADAIARGRGKGWSLPLRQRGRLTDWLDRWFSAEQISGSLDEPPAPAAVGMPEAGEILLLCMRREELRRMIRELPVDTGPVYRQIVREITAIEYRLADIAMLTQAEGSSR